MTVSPNKLLAGGLCGLMLMLSPGVLAQSDTPRVLRPGATAPVQPAQPTQNGGVRVDRLDAPGRVAAGVLREPDGGLSADLWSGSERQTIAALLQRMPPYYQSAAARDLARRLLLSAGDVPAGLPDDATLLAQRVRSVLTLGDAESAVALAEAAGSGAPAPAVAEALTEALFTLGETDRACGTVQGQIRLGGRGYWQQASVFCDIRGNRFDAAELTLSLLAETGGTDATFRTLSNALLEGTAVRIEADPTTSALHVAMAQEAKSSVILKMSQMPPHLALHLATAGSLNEDNRIQAGVRAVRFAGMSPAVVMLLFGNSAGDPGQPFRTPVVTAMTAETAIVRAEAVNDLWARAEAPEDKAVAAAFSSGFLAKLKPDASLAFLSPAAFRMSILNGEDRRAESWLLALRRSASSGGLEPGALSAVQPLARIAGFPGADNRALGLWLDNELGEGGNARRAYSVLLVLDALGDPVSGDLWRRLLADAPDTGPRPATDLALWRQLVMASGANRMGESIQSVLAMIGSGGASALNPVELATIVGSLRRMGLEPLARQIALESLIGQGG